MSLIFLLGFVRAFFLPRTQQLVALCSCRLDHTKFVWNRHGNTIQHSILLLLPVRTRGQPNCCCCCFTITIILNFRWGVIRYFARTDVCSVDDFVSLFNCRAHVGSLTVYYSIGRGCPCDPYSMIRARPKCRARGPAVQTVAFVPCMLTCVMNTTLPRSQSCRGQKFHTRPPSPPAFPVPLSHPPPPCFPRALYK